MAFSQRNKYGVPISQEKDIRQGLQQPKFANRFRVRFDSFGNVNPSGDTARSIDDVVANNIVTGSVESFTRPSFSFNKQEVNSFISNATYASRPTFEDFTLVIRDEITNTVIGRIYNQLKMQTYKYQPVSTPDGENMIKSKYLGISTKFDVHVDVMDGRTNHTPLETWSFYGCEITNLSSSEQSYEDSQSIIRLTLSCCFDHVDVTQPSRVQFASNPGYEEDKSIGGQASQNTNTEGIQDTGGDNQNEQLNVGASKQAANNILGRDVF